MSIAEVETEPFDMTEIAIDHAIHSIFQGIGVLEEMKLSNEGQNYIANCIDIHLAADRLARIADGVRGI